MYVADTSVVVKWFNQTQEADVQQAVMLLEHAVSQQILLCSSDLMRYELANALAVGKRLEPTSVRATLELLDELPVALIESTPALFEQAAMFAQRYTLSVYDAIFVALAIAVDGTLVTANPRHQAKVREATVLPLHAYPPQDDPASVIQTSASQ